MFSRSWTRSLSALAARGQTLSPSIRLSSLVNHRRPLQTKHDTYKCDIDAEPIHRYRPGGYHPISLGDELKSGRYKILHKIGWGGFSTTWAARDQSESRYVAIKISVSESTDNHEAKVLQAISAIPRQHPGQEHVAQLLDYFTVVGPNGAHSCLVMDLMGPNVPDFIETCHRGQRLPAEIAKRSACQVLQGVDFLARHKIGHGDLHTRNIVFTIPSVDSLTEQQFFDKFGKPEVAHVTTTDSTSLTENIPSYIVRPAPLPAGICQSLRTSSSIKIIDFGEAFLKNEVPETLHTPLAVRAPEAILGDQIDHRVDLWSFGCLLFELVAGQPPFDSIMATPTSVVSQMLQFCTDEMPSRWREKWQAMNREPVDDDPCTLQQWLEEVYFDDGRRPEFTKQEITRVSRLVGRLLKFEPSSRALPRELLEDPWFKC